MNRIILIFFAISIGVCCNSLQINTDTQEIMFSANGPAKLIRYNRYTTNKPYDTLLDTIHSDRWNKVILKFKAIDTLFMLSFLPSKNVPLFFDTIWVKEQSGKIKCIPLTAFIDSIGYGGNKSPDSLNWIKINKNTMAYFPLDNLADTLNSPSIFFFNPIISTGEILLNIKQGEF